MTPRRRVWLYSPGPELIEVAVIAPNEDGAPVFATIASAFNQWYGFRDVNIMGGNLCGIIAAKLTPAARGDDELGEALHVLSEYATMPRGFEWSASSSAGIVGTW